METKFKKYNLIFSIGAECFCTQALRFSWLQNYSYPFDWLYGSNIYERLKTLEDEFQDWFNKEDLEYFGERQNPHPCTIYKNKKTDIIFNHDFPIKKDFDEAFSEVSEKYNRRINRLIKLIKKSKKVLLVYMYSPEDSFDYDKNIIFNYLNRLSKKYKNTIFDLLIVTCSDTKTLNTDEFKDYNSTIYKYSIDFKSKTYEQGINSWDFEALKTLLNSFKLKDNRKLLFEISKIKKGVQMVFLPRIPTLINIFLYIFGLRINLFIGRERKF